MSIHYDDIPMMMEVEAGQDERITTPVLVGFGYMPCPSKKKSAVAGHPVFEERLHVKILVPGDKQTEILVPATDRHKERFPKTYSAFQAREVSPTVEGLLIEEWPQISRSMALTLRAGHVYTVEALAAVHDGHIDKIGANGRELRAKARAFLDIAKDTAASQAIAAENARKDAIISDMQRQIGELARLVNRPASEAKPRGWPKGKPRGPRKTVEPQQAEDTHVTP